MTITHEFKMDLARPGESALLEAVQGDSCARQIRLILTAENRPWKVPEDTRVLVRYCRPDGNEGVYDTLPDGTTAVTVSGSTVSVVLIPEVLLCPGRGKLSVTLYRGDWEVTTWSVELLIHHNYGADVTAGESYRSISGMLPAPESAEVGQYFVIDSVDPQGKVMAVRTVDAIDGLVQTEDGVVYLASGGTAVGSGLQLAAGYNSSAVYVGLCTIRSLLAKAVYTEDVSALLTDLDEALENSKTEVILITISASYSGGAVPVGTEPSELTGILVTAFYSDGSSKPVKDYTIYGTIALGDNPVTVVYGGKTATFIVPGVEAGGDILEYPVTNNLTNVTTSNSAATVQAGSAYTATLLAAVGYTLASVIVTMGGEDISAKVCSGGSISIPAVTGPIVITAVAAEEVA